MSPENFILTGLLLTLFVSTAALFWFAKQAWLNLSIVFAFIAWSSYFTIHKVSTGSFVDNYGDIEDDSFHEEIRKHEDKLALSTAFIGFGTGAVLLIRGLENEIFILALIGSSVMLSSYMMAHYLINGEIV